MSEWQPIETAPRDGTDILVFRADCGVLLARWCAPEDFMTERELEADGLFGDDAEDPDWFYADFLSGGRLSNDGLPTHWQPLPEPPTA